VKNILLNGFIEPPHEFDRGQYDTSEIKIEYKVNKMTKMSFSVTRKGLLLQAGSMRRGIAMNKMKERGWAADACMIPPDEAGRQQLLQQLSSTAYDCVVVGAGLRLPPKSLLFFESVINLVHRAAPNSSIAFNMTPQDTAEAAGRWI
jgi:hypothetical protein